MNVTDPSGFATQGAGWAEGFGGLVLAGAAVTAFGGDFGIGALLGGANVGAAGLQGLAGAGRAGSGGPISVTPGAQAPNSTVATQGSTSAVAQNDGVGPAQATTNAGPAAPCGKAGNPRCGDPAKRAARIPDVLKQIDQLVRDWRNKPSPVDPSGKERIVDSTVSKNARHRVELAAGIVIDADGVPRLTRTFIGTLDSSAVDWEKVGLKPGDRIVGDVHTHPGGGFGAEHFSAGDLEHGRDVLKQLQAQPGSRFGGVGVQIYVVQPADAGGGILNFNVARNVITPVP